MTDLLRVCDVARYVGIEFRHAYKWMERRGITPVVPILFARRFARRDVLDAIAVDAWREYWRREARTLRAGRTSDEVDQIIRMAWPTNTRVDGECLVWTGLRSSGGYGSLRGAGVHGEALTHRIALTLALGRRLNGWALHRCDNPPCLRVAHLYEGGPAANSRDRDQRGRGPAGLRHGNAKLTQEQVAEILRRHRPGTTRWDRGNSADLAREFGITKSYLSMIVKNGHWSLMPRSSQAAGGAA